MGLVVELGFEMGVHHYLVEDVGVVVRNGLGLTNRAQGVFGHIHLMINLIDSIVISHEVFELVGPIISSVSKQKLMVRVASLMKTHRIRSHPPPISHGRSNITSSSLLLSLTEDGRKRFPRSSRSR